MERPSRRGMLKGVGASALGASAFRRARAQGASTIKLPILLSLSGPVGAIGAPAKLGAEITAELINKKGGVLGKPIELVFIDDKAKPNDAVAAVREAIADGQKIIGGLLLSPLILAALPVLTQTKTILIGCGGTSMSLTHELYTPFFFSGTTNDYQRANAMGHFAAQKFPDVLNWGGIITDSGPYISSYNNFVKIAKEAYAAAGKQANFADPYLLKLGGTDFRVQLEQCQASSLNALWTLVLGTDGLTLWQQAQAFNLGNQIKAVIDQTTDFNIARALKKNLPPNLWTLEISYYPLHADDPVSKEFYDAAIARTGTKYPSGYIQYGHQTVIAMVEAIRATNNSMDVDAMIRALVSATLTTAAGKLRYRKEDHTILNAMDFAKVVPSDDPDGFKVADAVMLQASDYTPPPDPGKPFTF